MPLIRSWIGELGVKAEVRLPEADGFNWYVNHHRVRVKRSGFGTLSDSGGSLNFFE